MALLIWINAQFRFAMRRLLQIDRSILPRSEDEIAAEVERNFPWNFRVNLVEGATFFFGLSFISSSTVVPLFISKLTPSPVSIGLVSVIAQGGWYLPQIFTAYSVERLPHKKPVIVNLGFFLERVPVWALVGVTLMAGSSPGLALALFMMAYAWHHVGAGLVATAWQDLIARCFPVDRRGRFWGLTTFAGTGTGIIGASLSAHILSSFSFPASFTYVFAIAAASITISWLFLALTREPAQSATPAGQTSSQFWRGLFDILRRDHNFRRFLLARLAMTMGNMGVGFVTVAAVQRWGVPDKTVGIYTAAMLLGQALGNLIFGFLADRYGHKLPLELSALASILAFGLAWLAPAGEWYYAVFLLLGVALGGVLVSGVLMTLEFSEAERRPTYVGLANTGVGLAGVAAPLLATGLASFSYNWLFAVSGGISLVALALMRWWVQEPRLANVSVSA